MAALSPSPSTSPVWICPPGPMALYAYAGIVLQLLMHDSHYFLDGRQSLQDLLDGVLLEGAHALGPRLTLDLGGRFLGHDHLAEFVREFHQLIDADSALVPTPAAGFASGTLVVGERTVRLYREFEAFQHV